MYPLPAVLVGIEDGLLPDLRRELSHATVQVEREFTAVSTALECLRPTRKQPRLLIVALGTQCDAGTIERMSSILTGWPILAVLTQKVQAADLLEINRAGAAQMVSLPLDRDDFQRALHMIGAQFGTAPKDRHVLAVTGAAGGSGTTTLAINLAHKIAFRLGRPTILAELSLQMGVLASMLDLQPRVTLPHLIRESHRIDDFLVEKTLVPAGEALSVLAGPQEVQSFASIPSASLVKIVECLRKLAEVTVLDMGGAFDDLKFEVLKCSDQVLLVGLQTVPSIRALKMFCGALPEETVLHSLWVVINRYNPSVKGFSRAEIQEMLGAPRICCISNDFHAVNRAVNRGRPLREVAPGSPILRDVDELMHEVLELDRPSADSNGKGIFGRVFHALKR
jgi:pilus assembly protein CpaE